jgi:WD40-like Beta Propeller Repeat
VLYTLMTFLDWTTASLVFRDLESGTSRVLLQGGVDARYVPTGHLLYMQNGTLLAVPFDARAGQVTGAPVALLENVMQGINAPNGIDKTGAGQFAVSPAGTLAYVDGGVGPTRKSTLVWVGRRGAARPLASAGAGAYLEPRLSPDGGRIATEVRREGSREADVWVYDVGRGSPTRLTFAASGAPVWSPDGRRIAFGADALYGVAADGSGQPQLLLQAASGTRLPTASSWARESNTLAFLQRTEHGSYGLWGLSMRDGERGTPTLLVESTFVLRYPELSPDGRWLAYTSNESGASEVYVQPYAGPGGKVRISTAGGLEPLWNPNGRELLYRNGTATAQQVLSVPIRSVSPFAADTPRVLFEAKPGMYEGTRGAGARRAELDRRREAARAVRLPGCR